MRLAGIVVVCVVMFQLGGPRPARASGAPAPPAASAAPGGGSAQAQSGEKVVGLLGLCLVNAGVLVEGYAGWQESGKAALVGLGLIVGGFAILASGEGLAVGGRF